MITAPGRQSEQPHCRALRGLREDIFARSLQFLLMPMYHPLPENASVLEAGSQQRCQASLHAAIEGCHFFNAECHSGCVRTGT